MNPTTRLQDLLNHAAVLTTDGLRFVLAHAEFFGPAEQPTGLLWIALPAESARRTHVTPIDRAALHGPGITLWRDGEIVAFVTTPEDTPEINTDDTLEAAALFRAKISEPDSEWEAFVQSQREDRIPGLKESPK